MRAQQGRSDDTGVTAALIELIERPANMLTRNTSPSDFRALRSKRGGQEAMLASAQIGCHEVRLVCSNGFYSP